MRLTARSAIVTGGAGGIGSAIAATFAREGANVCLSDIRRAEHLGGTLRSHGIRVIEHCGDLRDEQVIKQMVQQATEAFGAIDILVNAAGITSHGSAEDVTDAEWRRVIDTNLKSVFFCCQAVLGLMKERRTGRIINIGSVVAKNGGNPRPWIDASEQSRASNIVYGAAKAGVHALTLFLAKELAGYGVTVNCVAPGPVASRMTSEMPAAFKTLIPLGRMGSPADVAEVVAFLASDAAQYVTGEILDVNGGLWCD